MKLLKVLIEYAKANLATPFSYLCESNTKVNVGSRVYVPFGSQSIVGYVVSIEENNLSASELCLKDKMNYKFIHSVLDENPILDEELFKVAKYLEKEYVTPLILCLQTILPPSYKPAKTALKKISKRILKKVVINENVDVSNLKSYQLELFNQIKEANGIFLKDLPMAKVKTLEKHGYVYEIEEEVIEDYLKDYTKLDRVNSLNVDQQNAVDKIINSSKNVSLLQGVTGSGKTEVYISLVDYYLKQGKTAIVLVPEISLTPMIIKRFKDHFNDIALLHGSLSSKEKQIQYDKIKNGEVRVVIGARSAIFAPLKNIGIIILDEEQSNSYKQDKSPTYHARDIAIYRSKHFNCKVVLGSATPSFESKARAMKGVYEIVYLNRRANNLPLPHIDIINMREELTDFSSQISQSLDYEIRRCLDNKEKVILLQNRRGYSPYVSCRKCGYTYKCPNCELSMSYHKNGDKFKCHYCNYEIRFNHKCAKCDGTDFLFMGTGTQKIEEIIEQNYPSAKILRMDNDTTNVKNGHLKILEEFESDDYNILLGTQMVAKGLDFKDVTLVGVINADMSLSAADFRSAEQTFELLSQVAGRAGRGLKAGRVVIQTYNPDHYAIEMASTHDYESFYKKDMLFRYKMKYPPFSYISTITVMCEKSDQAIIVSDKISDELKKYGEFEILGPAFPYRFKEKDLIRMKILVKSKNHDLIRDAFNKVNEYIKKEAMERKCSVSYDIDTYQLL